jgi:Cys-tRNA(Pro) deacylase
MSNGAPDITDDKSRINRVTEALRALGIEPEMHVSADGTHTAEAAAAAAGCELGQIVKTLVVFAAGRPHFVLVPGDRRLDDRLLAARFAVGRKQIKLASAAQVLELTGYPVGGVSPFGAVSALDMLIDSSFRRFDRVWLAGGTASAIFPLALEVLLRVTQGEFATVTT